MSLYQTAIELRPKMSLAPALLAVRPRMLDALMAFHGCDDRPTVSARQR